MCTTYHMFDSNPLRTLVRLPCGVAGRRSPDVEARPRARGPRRQRGLRQRGIGLGDHHEVAPREVGRRRGCRDPFDRMLAAQAVIEGVPIVSNDEAFDLFGVMRLW